MSPGLYCIDSGHFPTFCTMLTLEGIKVLFWCDPTY
jgi:hypothetical protein